MSSGKTCLLGFIVKEVYIAVKDDCKIQLLFGDI